MKIKISTIEAGQKSASICLTDIEGVKLNDGNNGVRLIIFYANGAFNCFFMEETVNGTSQRAKPLEDYNFRFVVTKCRFSKRRFEKLHGILVDNIDFFVALLQGDNYSQTMYLALKALLKL